MPRQVSEVEKRSRASPTLEARRAAMNRRNVTSQVSHAKESSRTFLKKNKKHCGKDRSHRLMGLLVDRETGN